MALVRFQIPLNDLSVPSEELRQVLFSKILKTSRKFELNQSRQKSIYLATHSCNCLCQGESYKSHIAKTDGEFLCANMFNSIDSICLYISFCRMLYSSSS